MRKAETKKYNVRVIYTKRTPEEAARLEAQITDVIYKFKMAVMAAEEKEAVNT